MTKNNNLDNLYSSLAALTVGSSLINIIGAKMFGIKEKEEISHKDLVKGIIDLVIDAKDKELKDKEKEVSDLEDENIKLREEIEKLEEKIVKLKEPKKDDNKKGNKKK
ncbi:MAG: hypothetical protein ACOCUI_01135 [bacterium]